MHRAYIYILLSLVNVYNIFTNTQIGTCNIHLSIQPHTGLTFTHVLCSHMPTYMQISFANPLCE